MKTCTIVDALVSELMYNEETPQLKNVHSKLSAHPRRCLDKEWKRLCDHVECMQEDIDAAASAMTTVAYRYGYKYSECDWWGENDNDVPSMGDDTSTNYLETYVQEFAELYRNSVVFMTRKGQRSQPGGRYQQLPPSGRTPKEERLAEERRIVCKRKRDEKVVLDQANKMRCEELRQSIARAESELVSLLEK